MRIWRRLACVALVWAVAGGVGRGATAEVSLKEVRWQTLPADIVMAYVSPEQNSTSW